MAFLFVAAPCCGGEVTIGNRLLRVAEGFDIELAAGPPQIERPISVSMDFKGDLYATDSGGMTRPAAEQLAIKPHRIRRLRSSHGDGHFDESALLADHMMFPEGCLWMDGSLYIAAPPQIWKITDVDGAADHVRREVWFDGKTLTGCGNDLHGPYLGRDGWIYWCKGAFATQRYTLPNGKPLVTTASHIFRARPDGSGLEPVMTGGMDNPVGVAQLSTGERILSCTFFQQPRGGHRDGLIHVIYGGIYGKEHEVLDGHVATGSLMPVLVHEGAAAPCGIIAASDGLWGGGFGDHLVACYFNLRKVILHELVSDGATFTTHETDLIACDHPDFHPTDVFEDADGTLLIVDTGGWYKVCCPTSALAKPDVFGAIYRVKKRGQPPVEDPLGLNFRWDELKLQDLARLVADNRLFVRRQAVARLRAAGAAAVDALRDVGLGQASAAQRREAVWALSGIDAPGARAAIRGALTDRDPSIRAAAISAAGLWRDRDATRSLESIVVGDDATMVRPAAEALGRIGDPRSVNALLKSIGKLDAAESDSTGSPLAAKDRILEHSLIYALIEIADSAGVISGLTSPSNRCRRAAVVALDQMDPSPLKPEEVIPLLKSEDIALRRTAQWVVGHRPQWGSSLAGYFRENLGSLPASQELRNELADQLAHSASSTDIQTLLSTTLMNSGDVAVKSLCLRAMREANLPQMPDEWQKSLARLITQGPPSLLSDAVTAARAFSSKKPLNALLSAASADIGRNRSNPPTLRIEALQAAGKLGPLDDALFADLISMLKPAATMQVRRGAEGVLAEVTLSNNQFVSLAQSIKEIGPMEMPEVLAILSRAEPTETLGRMVVASLKDSAGRRNVKYNTLKALLDRYPEPVRKEGAPLLAELNINAAQQVAHLAQLNSELPPGDIRRGQELFLSSRVGCNNCHNLGYRGGNLGPDMTSIGKVRSRAELLEAIIYPSASFARGYEPVILKLRGGDAASGIIASQTASELVLNTGPQDTRHFALAEIAEIRPSSVSLMPDGFESILSKQELSDLLAFLEACK